MALTSGVRALAFGPESEYVTHLGVYVATLPLDGETGSDLVMYNTPGRSVANSHPARRRPIAVRSGRPRSRTSTIGISTSTSGCCATRTQARAGACPSCWTASAPRMTWYFDSVSRVPVPTWSNGRVTLVGDAASCVSLFGDGSSLAMTGAFTLADALTGDIPSGLRDYEVRHRPQRAAKENAVTLATNLFVPATRVGIAVRNVAVHVIPLVLKTRETVFQHRKFE